MKPRTWFLRSACLALALLATALPSASSNAQAVDCSGNEWLAGNTAEFDAALACWEAAAEPGDYTITLTGNLDGRPTIPTRSADLTLTVDGAGARMSRGVFISGVGRDPVDQESPITIRNLEIASEGLLIIQANATIEDVEISGVGVSIGGADVRLTRATILRMADNNALAANDLSRVLLEDSFVGAVTDDPAFIIEDSLFVVRNSIVREATGLYEFVEDSEILFDRSAIIDNDTNLLAYVSSYCCGDTTISYINSTFAQDDENGAWTVGIGERERSLVQVANSTVLENGPYGIIGPVDVQSSIVDQCEVADPERPQDPAAIFVGRPVDQGGTVGGCFGDGRMFEYPLADYGCAAPTPFGCVPTIATTPSSPARGAGLCDNTIVATPADLFSIDFADLEPGVNSVLTATGTQNVDGRGFPRTSCDAGSYESDGNEPTTPQTLRIATWDLNHPPASDEIAFFYAGELVADAMDLEDIDILFVQRALRGPVGGHVFDRAIAQLWFLGEGRLYDFAPAYDSDDPPTDAYFMGQGIFSPLPILSRSATEVANPIPGGVPTVIHEVILDATPEPLRLVNVRSHDEAPCAFVRTLNNWLAEQPEMTTIVAGNLAADRSLDCVGEFTADWVDACASPAAQPNCERTIRPTSAEITDATQDYLLHRPAPGSTFALTNAEVANTPIGFTDHQLVIATYDLNAANTDVDEDGVVDAVDNCPSATNAGQGDSDGDGIGDGCDPVSDGDANCDGSRDIIDALVIAQFDASVRTGTEACPVDSPATEIYTYGADANNDGTTDIIDALLMAQCSAAIQNTACPEGAD